jgi:Protein of unknown function (DUF2971)
MINTATSLRIDRLYHYQSFEKPEQIARIFTDGTLYFSKPSNFNDPWDCRPFFDKAGLDDCNEYERTVRWFVNCDRKSNTLLSSEELSRREQEIRKNRKLLEYFIDQMSADMERAIQEQYRVYCLSTHPDSTLMWSHYADSCKGICLEFSVRNNLFCRALQIEYLSSYPLFALADENEYENIRPLLTKSDVWWYENEFRLIASEHPIVFEGVPTTRNGFLSFPKESLEAVIIGPLMRQPDQKLIRSIVSGSGWNVALKVASLVPDRYKLEIKAFEE